MKEFGLQLYSIRDHFTNEKNTKESFRKIAEMGYTFAQTAGTYDYISPEKFREYADEAGIKLVSTHYDYARIQNDIEGTVKYHKAIGADYIGVGGVVDERFKTPATIREFIEEFNALAAEYAKYGFKLTYHNHSGEFVKVEGKPIFDYLIEGFDPDRVSFCLDTCWAQYAGVDVCGLIERISGRVDIIHLKDLTPNVSFELKDGRILHAPRMIEVGSGNMDFKRIVDYGKRSGAKYFVVEDEFYSTGNSMESVNISANYIKANLLD